MKRVLLTSPNFQGTIQLLYDLESKLVIVDLQETQLDTDQSDYLIRKVPVVYNKETFKQSFGNSQLNILESNVEVTFELFYSTHGVLRNPDRAKAFWNRMNKTDQIKAHFKRHQYDRYCAMNGWYTKVHPTTYLKERYWEQDWR